MIYEYGKGIIDSSFSKILKVITNDTKIIFEFIDGYLKITARNLKSGVIQSMLLENAPNFGGNGYNPELEYYGTEGTEKIFNEILSYQDLDCFINNGCVIQTSSYSYKLETSTLSILKDIRELLLSMATEAGVDISIINKNYKDNDMFLLMLTLPALKDCSILQALHIYDRYFPTVRNLSEYLRKPNMREAIAAAWKTRSSKLFKMLFAQSVVVEQQKVAQELIIRPSPLALRQTISNAHDNEFNLEIGLAEMLIDPNLKTIVNKDGKFLFEGLCNKLINDEYYTNNLHENEGDWVFFKRITFNFNVLLLGKELGHSLCDDYKFLLAESYFLTLNPQQNQEVLLYIKDKFTQPQLLRLIKQCDKDSWKEHIKDSLHMLDPRTLIGTMCNKRVRKAFPNGITIPNKWATPKELHDNIQEQYLTITKISDSNVGISYQNHPKIEPLDHKVIGDLVIRLPKDKHTLNEWGQTLHNCIGSYFNRIISDQSIVIGFYRNQQIQYAMELQVDKIDNDINKLSYKKIQLRAKHNEGVKDIKDFDLIANYFKKHLKIMVL
jgi:hypothetical protein